MTSGHDEFADVRHELISLLEQLEAVEVAKGKAAFGSQALVDLAVEAVGLAQTVARWTEVELRLARAALRDAHGGFLSERILSLPLDRQISVIFAAWREAEGRRDDAPAGSQAESSADDEVDQLEKEYSEVAQSLRDRASRRPEP